MMSTRGKKFKGWNIVGIIVIVAIFMTMLWLWMGEDDIEIPKPEESLKTEEVVATGTDELEIEDIPTKFHLEVPFSSQAPSSDWGQPYQDACEEAAVLNVHYFYEGKTFTKEIADEEILDLVDFENDFLGFYRSTTAAELVEVIKEYWGYDKVEIIDDPTVDDIKKNIAAGRPVIVPAAGRELGNHNFTAPGPLYHMYVIRGYDETSFYTNDVGTRLGENYRYDIDTVMQTINDWNGEGGLSGEKRVIVIYPQD